MALLVVLLLVVLGTIPVLVVTVGVAVFWLWEGRFVGSSVGSFVVLCDVDGRLVTVVPKVVPIVAGRGLQTLSNLMLQY